MGETYGYISGRFGRNRVFADTNPSGQTEASIQIQVLNPDYEDFGNDYCRKNRSIWAFAKWFGNRGREDEGCGYRELYSIQDLLNVVQEHYDRGLFDCRFGKGPP